jgi:hypothetical protein
VVRVFDISGRSDAQRAYAWSSPVEGSNKRKFFAVLHVPPVDSPLAAVRAAIVAERRHGPFDAEKYKAPALDKALRNLPPRKDRE